MQYPRSVPEKIQFDLITLQTLVRTLLLAVEVWSSSGFASSSSAPKVIKRTRSVTVEYIEQMLCDDSGSQLSLTPTLCKYCKVMDNDAPLPHSRSWTRHPDTSQHEVRKYRTVSTLKIVARILRVPHESNAFVRLTCAEKNSLSNLT